MEFTYTLKNGTTRTVNFSTADLDTFCGSHIGVEWVREQTAFMAIGFAGMAEHRYMSRDWIANNTLFCAAYNKILDLAGESAAREICDRMKASAGRHACAATSR